MIFSKNIINLESRQLKRMIFNQQIAQKQSISDHDYKSFFEKNIKKIVIIRHLGP